MTCRRTGICHDSECTAYYSFGQSQTLAHLSGEASAQWQTVDTIYGKMRQAPGRSDHVAFVAVFEGEFDYLRPFQGGLGEPDLAVFVSDASTLHRLGVQVVDETWSRGDPQIGINSYTQRQGERVGF